MQKSISISLIVLLLFGGALWLTQPTKTPLSAGPFGAVYHFQNTREQGLLLQINLPHGEPNYPLAHYTEHLVWQNAFGDQTRQPDRHSGAWTNKFGYIYRLQGQPKEIDLLLQSLGRIFDPLTVSEQFALEERDIVRREYDLYHADTVKADVDAAMDAFLFKGTPFAQTILGDRKTIAALEYGDARRLHTETHRPERASLTIIGNIDAADLQRALGRLDIEASDPSDRVDLVESSALAVGEAERKEFRFEDAGAADRLVRRHVVPLPDPMDYDELASHTALLSDWLGSNIGGSLTHQLMLEDPVAASINVFVEAIGTQTVQFSVTARPNRDVDLATLAAALEGGIARLNADGISQSSFSRIKARLEQRWPNWNNQFELDHWMAGYTLDRLAVRQRVRRSAHIRSINTKLTLASANALLQTVTGPGRTAVALIGSKERLP